MRFSVLMSVYGKELAANLEGSLFSIFDEQTRKPDQIVLVLDGPLNQGLYAVVDSWQERLSDILTVVRLPENLGLARALNIGLLSCENELVARMDADDVAMPDRFERQLSFMMDNPSVDVSSGYIEEWCQDLESKITERRLPLTHKDIYRLSKYRSPISHAAVIFKKSAVVGAGGYPLIYPEDYPLWGAMLAKGYVFANLPEVLLKVRVGEALAERRGAEFLKGELAVFKHLYSVGLINKFELYCNFWARAFLRLSPSWLKLFMYKNLR